MKRKYQTILELANAFKLGELNDKEWIVILDNDDCYLQYRGPVPEGEDEDTFCDKKYKEGNKLFRGNGYFDLQEAYLAAGIPCEWC